MHRFGRMLILVAALQGGAAAHGAPRDDRAAAPADSMRLQPASPAPESRMAPLAGIVIRRETALLDSLYPARSGEFTLTAIYPARRYSLLPEPEIRPLNLWKRTIYGADKGAYAGLGVGYLGSMLGLWDEKTAWALMGAGAAAGAIWSSAGGGSRISVGVRPDRDP